MKLKKLVKRKICYGIVQPGSGNHEGVPVIKAGNIVTGLNRLEDLELATEASARKYPRSTLNGGELVISLVGSVGKVAVVPTSFSGANLVRATGLIDIEDNTLKYWVKYYIESPEGQDYIRSNLNTTVQPTLNIKSLEEMDIPIIEEGTMKRTVSILRSIEDRLVNNALINENLSNQIQAIYSNTFDPTTHTPFGVLADICSYSSDRIPVSELSVSTYFSTENMQPNKIGSVDATSLPSITQTTGCHKGDVLVSNIRPYFKKIVYVKDDCCGCSTDVLCFVPKEDQYSAFLFGTLYMDCFFDYMVAGSKGTKMPRGDKQQIMNYPVVLPDKESLDLFNGLVVPMLDQIATNRVESSRLAALRDALLPKLMSGELNVSELDL